ncbi:MAG: NAD-dependent protein deacylase, partial [Planctomycetota bacterium]|nr:NAD-dependent protein deacylase [Planctomycetota bacterium]
MGLRTQLRGHVPRAVSAPRVVVLTGAGISADSGVATFRGAGGLWEGHAIEDVATPQAWERDPVLVWRFYQLRRAQLREVEPNPAHLALADLERALKAAGGGLTLVIQNVDDLHQRA